MRVRRNEKLLHHSRNGDCLLLHILFTTAGYNLMNKRIPLKGGDEFDALTGWRKMLKIFNKAGLSKKSKRKYNKRFRKDGKSNLREMDK